jgi:hypothetical protein
MASHMQLESAAHVYLSVYLALQLRVQVVPESVQVETDVHGDALLQSGVQVDPATAQPVDGQVAAVYREH